MKKIFAVIVSFRDKNLVLKLQKRLKCESVVIDNSENNLGFAKAANKGIRVALFKKATHILLINPDTKISDGFIDTLINTKGDIVGPVIKYKKSNKWIYDFGGQINWKWGRAEHYNVIARIPAKPETWRSRKRLLRGARNDTKIDYLSGCCLLIKREVFEKIGLLDERFFMYYEDADFCVRSKSADFKIKQANVNLIHDLEKPTVFKQYHNLRSNLLFILKYQRGINLIRSLVYWILLSTKVLLNQIL